MHPLALRGYLMAVIAVVILSPDSVLIRLAGDAPLHISALRGIVGGALILLFICISSRTAPWGLLRPVLAWALPMSLLITTSNLGFVYGIVHTNASNVLVIIAFTPMVSALLSAWWLKEHLALRTWIAVIVCALGLAIIFLQPVSGGERLGLIAAAVCAITMAIQFVIARFLSTDSSIALVAVGNIFCGVLAALLIHFWSLGPYHLAPGPTLLMVLVVVPVSFALIFSSMRYISAPETGLIMLLESILGSLWMWAILAELPSQATLMGGMLVIVTLSWHGWLTVRAHRQLHHQ